MTNYPTSLDTDVELYEVQNDVDDVLAAHHNALKEAIKALQEKVGIDLSAVETSLDYIINNMVVKCDPPSGKNKVVNLYVDSGKLHVDYDDVPV